AADADDQPGLGLLEQARTPEIVKHPLLRLLAHRTGVEEDHVGLFRVVGLDQFFVGTEHVRHLLGVVLVHLAPEGADVEFLHVQENTRLSLAAVRASIAAAISAWARAWPL